MEKRIVIKDYQMEAEGYEESEVITQLLAIATLSAKHFGTSKREIIKCVKKFWNLEVN